MRNTWRITVGLLIAVSLLLPHQISPAQATIQPKRVGVLLVARTPEHKDVQLFRQTLLDAGYAEDRDVVFEWKPVKGDYDLLPRSAAELVQHHVDVIVVEGTVCAQAAIRATTTIPIVMASVADPVGSKLVTNLAHPGANVTGLSMMIPDVESKRLALLKEMLPRVTRVGVLWNRDTPYHIQAIENLKSAATSLYVELSFFEAHTPSLFDPAIGAMERAHVNAIFILEDPFYFSHRQQIVKRVMASRLPVVYGTRAYADAGGLMSYGVDYGEGFRRAAGYVDKILKGAKPGDLPIEQPTRFEFVLNLRTAKSLGVKISDAILARADALIR